MKVIVLVRVDAAACSGAGSGDGEVVTIRRSDGKHDEYYEAARYVGADEVQALTPQQLYEAVERFVMGSGCSGDGELRMYATRRFFPPLYVPRSKTGPLDHYVDVALETVRVYFVRLPELAGAAGVQRCAAVRAEPSHVSRRKKIIEEIEAMVGRQLTPDELARMDDEQLDDALNVVREIFT